MKWKSVKVGEDGEYLLVLVKADDTSTGRVASFQLYSLVSLGVCKSSSADQTIQEEREKEV